MFKFSDKWLSVKTKNEIKKRNKDIFNETASHIVKETIKSPNSFLFIFPFVLLSYLLCFIDFNLPIITLLTSTQAIQILNAKLILLVSIFSISISISVFIISALQLRRIGEEQFSTIFYESYLYPIIYFIVSNIIILTFVSFQVNQTILNSGVIIRISVFSFYMFFISVILIITIFYRIYKFFSSNYLTNKYLYNLKVLANNELRNEIISRLSRKIYSDKFTPLLFKPSLWVDKHNHNFTINFTDKELRVVDDVNLKILDKMFMKLPKANDNSNYTFNPIGIGNLLNGKIELLSFDSNYSLKEKLNKNLRKIYFFKKLDNKSNIFEEQKEKLKLRLDNVINDEDVMHLKQILNVYNEIYDTLAKTINKFKIDDNPSDFPSSSFFQQGWNVIYNIDKQIYSSFERSIQNTNRDILLEIMRYVYNGLNLALENRSQIILNEFRYLPGWFCYSSYQNNTYKDFVITKIVYYLKEFIDFRLKYELSEERSLSENNKLLIFFYTGFDSLSRILKIIVDNKDADIFNKVVQIIEGLDNINETKLFELNNRVFRAELEQDNKEKNNNFQSTKINDLKELSEIFKTPQKYYFYLIFGIHAWLIYLYNANKINLNEFKELSKNIKFPNISILELFNELINFSGFRMDNLYDWRQWGNEDNVLSGKVYTPMTPDSWLNFAMVIFILKNYDLNQNSIKQIENNEHYRYLFDRIKYICLSLSENFDKWKDLIGSNITEEYYNKKIANLLDLFRDLKTRYEYSVEEIIAEQDLTTEKVNDFKDSVFKAWKESSVISNLFNYFKTIKYSEDTKSFKEHYGWNQNFIGYKMMFVEKENQEIFGMDDYGRELAKTEEIIFSNLFNKNIKEPVEFDNINSAFEKITYLRKEKGLNTSIILLNIASDMDSRELLYNPKYVPYWKEKSENKFIHYQGSFDNIPVIGLWSEFFHHKIIFCDFEKAFEMEILKDPSWMNEIIDIEVNKITDDLAVKILENVKLDRDRYKWAKNENNEELNDEQLLIKIKTGVNIKIYECYKFKIINENAYDVAYIKNKESEQD